MKNILFSIIIFFTLITSTFSHVNHYKDFTVLEYDLYRNNKLIGFHNYKFTREANNLNVKSKIEFNISKMGINLYKYQATSEEIYENENLINFSSKTNQNKKEKYVNIIFDRENNELNVDGSSYKGKASNDFIVGTWWNHEIVKAKAQISAVSGRIIPQKVIFIGKEEINVNGVKYNTLHFKFLSSKKDTPDKKKLNIDIWYDEKTKIWVKAAFDKTGYWEYRLKLKK